MTLPPAAIVGATTGQPRPPQRLGHGAVAALGSRVAAAACLRLVAA
jgi:hypothetical protein